MTEESYKDWVKGIQHRIDEPTCQWKRVGIYGFPSKHNNYFHDIMIHYCEKYYRVCKGAQPKGQARNFEKCEACGEKTPDGIKMIALLEKL